jgi:hypothetical protein
MKFGFKNSETGEGTHALDTLQRFALGGMFILSMLTFVGANLHAILWQSSSWLVSTVLPAVVVQLTNAERSDLSEAPLSRNATLDEAARMKAQHMAKNEYFAHYAPDGTSPWYWFDQAGYSYAHAGENLAIHFTDSTEVVEAWMDSPTHRANIVSGKYTEIGVGTAKGMYEGYETVYVVQLFGTPAATQVVKTTPAPVPTPVPVAQIAQVEVAPVVETPEVAGSDVEPAEVPEVTGIEEVPDETVDNGEIVVVPASTEDVASLPSAEDVVVVEKEMVATSSGLAVANIDAPAENNDSIAAGIATKPNTLLQIVYTLFGLIVVGLLITSVVVEARRSHYAQVAYGFGLLAIMAGLWYIHSLLTTGAIVV